MLHSQGQRKWKAQVVLEGLRKYMKEDLAKEETDEGTEAPWGDKGGKWKPSNITGLLSYSLTGTTTAFLGTDGGPGVSVSLRERTKGTGWFSSHNVRECYQFIPIWCCHMKLKNCSVLYLYNTFTVYKVLLHWFSQLNLLVSLKERQDTHLYLHLPQIRKQRLRE